jgi:hypothetical protein
MHAGKVTIQEKLIAVDVQGQLEKGGMLSYRASPQRRIDGVGRMIVWSRRGPVEMRPASTPVRASRRST